MTALIALPLLILLLGYASPIVFSVFLAVVLSLSLLEFNRMGLGETYRFEQWLATLFGVSVVPLLATNNLIYLFPLFTGFFLLFSLIFLFRFKSIENIHHHFGWILLGWLYLPLLLGHLIPLRLLANGQKWIFLTLMVIMGCDTLAYFVGSKFGKHKLYPAVSPNKSIEGALGGLAGSVLAVLLAKYTFMSFLGMIDGVLIGLLLGTAGQLGDLFESLLKRACQVKDSGHIIPGHGGMLDRLDSLLFAFPIAFYLAKYGYGG
ncbi:MAG: phosphatidate cytidylyltransferase [Deltaproteobacteria bacterium]|nr:phosphatidate cytidylyltransferase [Deltaproteobacteria bacterium]